MILVLTFLIFLTIFLIIINFFAILFRLTGIPMHKAKFQVISLLTSTGYTTKESEIIAQHPVRRKIASWLMIFSYLSTAIFISFIIRIISHGLDDVKSMSITAGFVVGFALLVFLVMRSSIPEKIELIIERLILKSKRWHNLHEDKLISVFQKKGYGIYEIYIGKSNYLIGKSIIDSGLKDLEIQVLSIDRGDKLINFPSPHYIFEVTDRITVYGNMTNIHNKFNYIKVSDKIKKTPSV
ncbi:TrkA C-terminal domain-containing protein [uncultured Clostridium sp.]|uniref:TrkA C-terminal domain-containing protein n=1 Tax=uncultured Clostridium sp. TaxID=59620 RepID=UPI00262D11FF|nr:TrkA C-terminal domain-containing protein [uncultured Clostridium sp.]